MAGTKIESLLILDTNRENWQKRMWPFPAKRATIYYYILPSNTLTSMWGKHEQWLKCLCCFCPEGLVSIHSIAFKTHHWSFTYLSGTKAYETVMRQNNSDWVNEQKTVMRHQRHELLFAAIIKLVPKSVKPSSHERSAWSRLQLNKIAIMFIGIKTTA